MTRETKIGLLVGLGFIVVFAVLLSHTTPMPPAGDDRLTVEALREQTRAPGQGPGERTVEDRLAQAPSPTGQTASGHAAPKPEPRATGRNGQTEGLDGGSAHTVALPRVGALEPKPVGPPGGSAGRSEPSGYVLNTESAVVTAVEYPRIAPPIGEPIAEPHPTARPAGPVASPAPEHQNPAEKSAPAPSVPPKRHLVRAGESLVQIAKARYGTAHPSVLDYLVDLNKPEIKDRNRVYQGQELVVPDLPPDLFAKVPSLAIAKITDGAQPLTLEKLAAGASAGASERRAPTPAKEAKEPAQVSPEPKEKKPDGAAGKVEDQAKGSDKATRWYEVQSGDTYTSIARKELGSTGLWKEIQRLNEKADPAKLRPGDRVLLPNKPMPEPFKPKRIPA